MEDSTKKKKKRTSLGLTYLRHGRSTLGRIMFLPTNSNHTGNSSLLCRLYVSITKLSLTSRQERSRGLVPAALVSTWNLRSALFSIQRKVMGVAAGKAGNTNSLIWPCETLTGAKPLAWSFKADNQRLLVVP